LEVLVVKDIAFRLYWKFWVIYFAKAYFGIKSVLTSTTLNKHEKSVEIPNCAVLYFVFLLLRIEGFGDKVSKDVRKCFIFI
jgi:hypothetical protein